MLHTKDMGGSLRNPASFCNVVAPNDSVVLTVGSVPAGTRENIIPAQAELKLNVRSFNDEVATRSVWAALSQVLGEEHAHEVPPLSGSEDFGTSGPPPGVPSACSGRHDPQCRRHGPSRSSRPASCPRARTANTRRSSPRLSTRPCRSA